MDLLKQKLSQAEMSIKEAVNNQLVQGTVSAATFVPGNSAKDLNPLAYFLRSAKATDPTTGGTFGNISSATYTWWRHNSASFGAGGLTGDDFTVTITTRAGLKYGLLKLYNLCTRGADGSGPNLILSGAPTYEAYEISLDASLRYADQAMADLGFDSIKLKGATWVWDETVPDVYSGTLAQSYDTAFFRNTKFYKLYIDSQTDFVTTPRQDGRVKPDLIDLEVPAGTTGRKQAEAVQRERLSGWASFEMMRQSELPHNANFGIGRENFNEFSTYLEW